MGLHFVAVPFPAQGHTTPMMRLCRMLARDGAMVTFVEPDAVHSRAHDMQQPQPVPVHDASLLHAPDPQQPLLPVAADAANATPVAADSSRHRPHLHSPSPGEFKPGVRRVPLLIDGFDLSKLSSTMEGSMECIHTMVPHLRTLLVELSESPTPVSCIIFDLCMTLVTKRAADEFRIPRVVFYTSCRATLLLQHHLLTHPTLTVDRALQIASEQSLSSEVVAEGLEGLPPVIRAKDLPRFCVSTDENPYMYRFFERVLREGGLESAHSILANGLDELERSASKSLAARLNLPIYGVGPLLELLAGDSATSLWREDEACMRWLDEQPPQSVLYISFGSIIKVSQALFKELVHGLLASRQRFIWVARPEIVVGDADEERRLLNEAVQQGRGCVVSWAPQVKVLAHSATGGFLTHCGWNSVMEAMFNGVPMLCWPLFADQPLDAKYIVEEWKIGLGFDTQNEQVVVDRGEVERCIRALMQESEGDLLRQNAQKLQDACHHALSPKGSSCQNLQAWLQSIRD